jgi:hypothetical protein
MCEAHQALQSKEFKISKFSINPISLYSLFNCEILAIRLFGKKNI